MGLQSVDKKLIFVRAEKISSLHLLIRFQNAFTNKRSNHRRSGRKKKDKELEERKEKGGRRNIGEYF